MQIDLLYNDMKRQNSKAHRDAKRKKMLEERAKNQRGDQTRFVEESGVRKKDFDRVSLDVHEPPAVAEDGQFEQTAKLPGNGSAESGKSALQQSAQAENTATLNTFA